MSARKIDKLRLPVIYDPENSALDVMDYHDNTTESIIQVDPIAQDHSLFMADMSLI